MDPLTSIGLVLWTLISLGLTLNVLHPLINRDRARPLSLIFGFGLGWLIGELTIQWILLTPGYFCFSWCLRIWKSGFFMDAGNSSASMDSPSGSALVGAHQVEYLEDQMLNQLGTEYQMTEAEPPPPKIPSGELETVRPARKRF